MANLVIVRPDGAVERNVSEDELDRAWKDGESLIWVDLERPVPEQQLERLTAMLDLHETAIEHLTQPHQGPRLVRLGSHTLLVIYDVTLLPDSTDIEKKELVALAGDRFLVSVHDATGMPLAGVPHLLERSLDRFGVEIGAIVFPAMEIMAERCLAVVEVVRRQVDALEDRVLNQEEPEGITELYRLRRQLTALRRVVAPEAALIGSRSTPMAVMANPEIQDAMIDIKHTMQNAVDDIDQYLNILPQILDTFEALKSDNLNRIVKLLTVWSIILTAVALFPTVMGISLSREPSIPPYVGYVISVAAMVLLGGAIWVFFKRHGWTD